MTGVRIELRKAALVSSGAGYAQRGHRTHGTGQKLTPGIVHQISFNTYARLQDRPCVWKELRKAGRDAAIFGGRFCSVGLGLVSRASQGLPYSELCATPPAV